MDDVNRLILWEQPEGIPWIVGFWAANRSIAVTPAPPEWASPEFTEAVIGGLCASIEGYCSRCEAVAPALPPVPLGEVACASRKVPHAAWCARSEETLKQLEEACRPPGARWVADDTAETMGRLNEYLDTLAARLNSERR